MMFKHILKVCDHRRYDVAIKQKQTRTTHWRTDANLYPLKRQLTKASEPSFDLEGGAQGQI